MKRQLCIYTLLLLTLGCGDKKTVYRTNNGDTSAIKETDQAATAAYSDRVYQSDSVAIDIKNDNFNYSIVLTIGNQKREYDLAQRKIPTTTPNEIKWANNDYACMMTWWSQAQSRHIFIPTKKTNELIYLDKDIAETDSVNNNIVYVDSVYEDAGKIVFKAENLLTRKSKELELAIDRQNETYPFYDRIILTKNKLTIITTAGEKSMDITEINKGL